MTIRCAAVILMAGLAGTAAADGLRPPEGDAVWPRWQLRAQVGPTALSPLKLAAPEAGSLLGDYYFAGAPGLRVESLAGGLRATGRLAFTGRGLPLGASTPLRLGSAVLPATPFADEDAAAALPYLGVGYSGATRDGAWRFSADFGLVADRPGGLRAGRQLQGEQAMDHALREMRLAPVLQLGVRYAF